MKIPVVLGAVRNATYKGASDGGERERDACLAEIEGLGGDQVGRRLWEKLTGYQVETTMDRIKTMFGTKLKGRSLEARRSESYCKYLVINKQFHALRPDYAIRPKKW